MNNNAFHEPGQWPEKDLGTKQTELVQIAFGANAIDTPVVVAVFNDKVLRTYTEGDGLTVAANRQSLVWELKGADFKHLKGCVVDFQFSFWREGVVEFEMKIKIIETYV